MGLPSIASKSATCRSRPSTLTIQELRAYGPLLFTKAEGFAPRTRRLPFIWFEDEREEKTAAARLASQPHLVI